LEKTSGDDARIVLILFLSLFSNKVLVLLLLLVVCRTLLWQVKEIFLEDMWRARKFLSCADGEISSVVVDAVVALLLLIGSGRSGGFSLREH
jgi:hypothetical protein